MKIMRLRYFASAKNKSHKCDQLIDLLVVHIILVGFYNLNMITCNEKITNAKLK